MAKKKKATVEIWTPCTPSGLVRNKFDHWHWCTSSERAEGPCEKEKRCACGYGDLEKETKARQYRRCIRRTITVE